MRTYYNCLDPKCSSVLLNRRGMWIWWSCKRNVYGDSMNCHYIWRVLGEWDSSLSFRDVSRFMVAMLKGERNLQRCQMVKWEESNKLCIWEWTINVRWDDNGQPRAQLDWKKKLRCQQIRCSSIGNRDFSWTKTTNVIESVKGKFCINALEFPL